MREIKEGTNYIDVNTNEFIHVIERADDGRAWCVKIDGNSADVLEDADLACLVEWDDVVKLMDDDLREEIHAAMAPCSGLDFWTEYLSRHEEKFGEPFAI